MRMGRRAQIAVLLLRWCVPCFAEDFRIEFTAGYWSLNPSGHIDTSSTSVDLRSDLGIRGGQDEGSFKVVWKPGAKHRINFEVIPFRLDGENTITRTIDFGGRTYPIEDHITSSLNIDYVFGGYQYDIVNNARGHFGIGGGIAYVNAKASTTSQTLGLTGTEQRQVPVPAIGGEFRFFPIPGKNIFNINGEVKGIAQGSYGSFIQASANAGLAVTRILRVQAGFNFADADVHKPDLSNRFSVRFTGPVFSVQLHD